MQSAVAHIICATRPAEIQVLFMANVGRFVHEWVVVSNSMVQ